MGAVAQNFTEWQDPNVNEINRVPMTATLPDSAVPKKSFPYTAPTAVRFSPRSTKEKLPTETKLKP